MNSVNTNSYTAPTQQSHIPTNNATPHHANHTPLTKHTAHGKATLMQKFFGRQTHTTHKPFSHTWRNFLAELLGTLFFVFLVSGSVQSPTAYGVTDLASQQLVTGLIQGFGLAACIYFVANVSGGHLNPAVSLSLFLVGRIGLVQLVTYVLAQIIGGVIGAALYLACVGTEQAGILGATVPGSISIGGAFLMELILSMILIFVVLGTIVDGNDSHSSLAPLPIGFTLVVCVMLAKPFTGGSLNPARSFGPAVASSGYTLDGWYYHWIYWIAPLAGAIIATFLYRTLFLSHPRKMGRRGHAMGAIDRTDAHDGHHYGDGDRTRLHSDDRDTSNLV